MATTTTPLERIWDAVEDLRHTLSDIERELETFEFNKSEPDAKACECRHPRKWHIRPTPPYVDACQTPDCPCRKFEPAGGDA